MKSIVFFFLLICSASLLAQVPGMKNGTITIDLGKKKQKQQDSIPQQADDEEDSIVKPHKIKKQQAPKQAKVKSAEAYDFRSGGLFRGIFHAGINAAQVDGDNEWGYKQPGAEFGIGALARFHQYLSASLEINYSMEGARARLASTDVQLQKYQVQWDYIQAAIALNGHYKDLIMLRLGLAPEVMVRYKEINYDGFDVTKSPPLGPPQKLGMEIFGGAHVIIKKHYAIGAKYSYSLLRIRDSYSHTVVTGQYNNLFNFSFMYILWSVKKK